MTRFEFINRLIEDFSYERYLEIGVSTGDCYRKIVCAQKTWIDPSPLSNEPGGIYMSSDDAFAAMSEETKFDIIFIDGDHRQEQVRRDIENSLLHLADCGTIVMHDCNPHSERAQLPYPTTGDWNGDVWKAFVLERQERKWSCLMMVVDTDQGLGIIRRLKDFDLFPDPVYTKYREEELTWEVLNAKRKELLHLLSVEEFFKWNDMLIS